MKYRAGSYVCEALAGVRDRGYSWILPPLLDLSRDARWASIIHATERSGDPRGPDLAWHALPSWLPSGRQEASGEVSRCSEQHQPSDHRRLLVRACSRFVEVPTPGSTNLQSRRAAHPANARVGKPATLTSARNSEPANGSSPGSRPSRDVVMKSWSRPAPPKVQAVTCLAATSITSSSTPSGV